MNEFEWDACADPAPMLAFLRGKASDRKLRLFAVACCDIGWDFIGDDRNRRAVEAAEHLADGAAERIDLPAVRASTRDSTAWHALQESAWDAAFRAARSGARDAARSRVRGKTWPGREERNGAWWLARAAANLTQAKVVRCIFGNPFRPRPPVEAAWLAWNDGAIVKMAQTMYADRAFDRLPLLADALEDAGCTDADLLSHLRGPGPHARGCWVLDLLLGLE